MLLHFRHRRPALEDLLPRVGKHGQMPGHLAQNAVGRGIQILTFIHEHEIEE